MLKEICFSFGIALSDDMTRQFQAYAALLLEWNKRIHLVSKRDAAPDRVMRHFVDSLCVFKAIRIPNNVNLLDIGAGAGFPSIPMKIVRNDVQMTLLESVHKKTLFLRRLLEVLELKKVTIINRRAEELSEEAGLVGQYDLVTAKALGRLKNTIDIGMPFLKKGGLLVAYKGREALKEIKETDFPEEIRLKEVCEVSIKEMDLFRLLAVMEKSE
jgi:16S rRNA (guanine527-N7)-methyltransferase